MISNAKMNIWISSTFRQASWAPLAVFIFYAIAAKGFDAYLLYPNLDIPTHFFGGMAVTHFFLMAIGHAQSLAGQMPRVIQSLCALGLTAMTAVVWEFLEFASDIALGTKMNLGVADTLSDLFFGLLGGTVMVVIGTRSKSPAAK